MHVLCLILLSFSIFLFTKSQNCTTIQNCFTCSLTPPKNLLTCNTCSQNYQYNAANNTCTPSQSTISTASIILASVFGAVGLIIVAIVIKYVIYKQRNPEEERQATNSASQLERNQAQEQNIYKSWTRQRTITGLNQDNQSLKSQCPICLEKQPTLMTNCKHCFHQQCLMTWHSKNTRLSNQRMYCPLCKSKRTDPVRFYCRQCKRNYAECELVNIKETKIAIGQKCQECQELIEIPEINDKINNSKLTATN